MVIHNVYKLKMHYNNIGIIIMNLCFFYQFHIYPNNLIHPSISIRAINFSIFDNYWYVLSFYIKSFYIPAFGKKGNKYKNQSWLNYSLSDDKHHRSTIARPIWSSAAVGSEGRGTFNNVKRRTDQTKKASLVIFDKDGTLIDFQSLWTPWTKKLVARYLCSYFNSKLTHSNLVLSTFWRQLCIFRSPSLKI